MYTCTCMYSAGCTLNFADYLQQDFQNWTSLSLTLGDVLVSSASFVSEVLVPFVKAFDAFLAGSFAEFVGLSEKIGGDVNTQVCGSDWLICGLLSGVAVYLLCDKIGSTGLDNARILPFILPATSSILTSTNKCRVSYLWARQWI